MAESCVVVIRNALRSLKIRAAGPHTGDSTVSRIHPRCGIVARQSEMLSASRDVVVNCKTPPLPRTETAEIGESHRHVRYTSSGPLPSGRLSRLTAVAQGVIVSTPAEQPSDT